jgi:alpha-beta hydrolase superfamily lysophospholipase
LLSLRWNLELLLVKPFRCSPISCAEKNVTHGGVPLKAIERTEYLKSFDGTELFFRCYSPAEIASQGSKISGLILAVHGFGEHSGRYADLAAEACSKNMLFACFDLRGHGKSGPRRGDAENLHALVLDVLFVINHARSILGIQQRQDLFFGLLGHSFGGLLLTYASSVLQDTCPPVFLSSPCYRVNQTIPRWKKFAAAALPRIAPLAPVPVDIVPANISENPENNAAYLADELNLFSISARFGSVFLGSMQEEMIQRAARSVRADVTLVFAGGDKLVDPAKTRAIAPLFAKQRLRAVEIANAGHEIFNELPQFREKAVSEFHRWIDARGLVG